MRCAAFLALPMACGVLTASDTASELTFIDLRAQGGISATTGHGAALTLMGGDIGDKDPHVIEVDKDVGFVCGLRAFGDYVHAKLDAGPTLRENELGGELLIGIGVFGGPSDLLEAVVGYGLGEGSDGTQSGFRRNASLRRLSGEVAYYHTMAMHYQIGVLIGYTYDKLKIKAPDGGTPFPAKAGGAQGAVEVGYRF